ncbi:NAD(P)H-binding protein [Methylopila sp. 73B]|uniref:NAD(P)H-binding protein n=1 Tax=Methylopila sp. 73B TaxID=1120792 RepID=UPI00037B9CA9|nr:NAD(P)H-binding protein [Methylopila sp. 73B]
MFAITGAAGQLGRLVIDALTKTIAADRIVAAVRTPSKAADLAARGVHVREADYDRPETLAAAFAGVEKLLLISSSEIGRRVAQHQAAIDAARAAGVSLVAYTSVLRAPTSALGLAEEHRQTEAALGASGLPHALLRNGWYTENYLASVPAALAHCAVFGAAGEGRIAGAARADYAEAAAAVLTRDDQAGAVWELAGAPGWTLADFAAELSRQTGRTIPYRDLSEADYAAALLQAGLPEPVARLLADSDAAAAKGALDGSGDDLRRLIGRASTPLADSVAQALKG